MDNRGLGFPGGSDCGLHLTAETHPSVSRAVRSIGQHLSHRRDTRTGCHSNANRAWPDLLDANEATWPFVTVGRVGCDENRQVKGLETLASNDASWSYCGRTADGILVESLRWPARMLGRGCLIKEIGAEIRDVDRMMQVLQRRLLRSPNGEHAVVGAMP
jgi:hypothetical protein